MQTANSWSLLNRGVLLYIPSTLVLVTPGSPSPTLYCVSKKHQLSIIFALLCTQNCQLSRANFKTSYRFIVFTQNASENPQNYSSLSLPGVIAAAAAAGAGEPKGFTRLGAT